MVRRWRTDLCVVLRWKRHHENNKQLCRVLQAQLHIGNKAHHSKQFKFLAAQSVSCLQWEQVHHGLFHMPRPSNPQTNKPTRQAGRKPMHIVHSQSTHINAYSFTWCVKFKKSSHCTRQRDRTSSSCDLTSLWASVQHTLYTSLYHGYLIWGKHFLQMLFHRDATPLKDKNSHILNFITVNKSHEKAKTNNKLIRV